MMADRRDCAAMPGAPAPRAVEIVVGDDPSRWAALGFSLAGGTARVGEVGIRIAGGAPGLRGLGLTGLRGERPDGLPILAAAAPAASGPAHHDNGALAVDHVVVVTDDAPRTSAALESAGLPLRRVRRPPESPVVQAFHLAGTLVLEVVESPRASAPALWGLVVAVADLDAAAALLGDRLGDPRAAVQPGRRIATVRDSAGLSTALALMTPRQDSNPAEAPRGLDGRTPVR
jgi:hypothetical protein